MSRVVAVGAAAFFADRKIRFTGLMSHDRLFILEKSS